MRGIKISAFNSGPICFAKHKFKLEQAKGKKNSKRDRKYLYPSEATYHSGQKNLGQECRDKDWP